MKGTNRATIHHLKQGKTTHAYYTYWKASKYFWVFMGFANFYLILVMQFLWIFRILQIFVWFHARFLNVVKIEFDTSYLSWGSSPKLASGSLLLVGTKPSPTVVGPPLLLGLLLLLLQVADPLASISLPVLC